MPASEFAAPSSTLRDLKHLEQAPGMCFNGEPDGETVRLPGGTS